MLQQNCDNIASRLHYWAKKTPQQIAISFPKHYKKGKYSYQNLTFAELLQSSEAIAQGLQRMNIPRRARVLVFLRPSLDFSAVTFALFKTGLVPIFIDPGMGRKNLLRSIAQIKPQVLIAEPEIHLVRFLFPRAFRSIRHIVTNSRWSWSLFKKSQYKRLRDLKSTPLVKAPPLLFTPSPQDPAAVLFTSGGTGCPKGVLYTHKIFQIQTDQLQKLFNLQAGQVDIPGFPLFSLFTVAMGMKSAIPAMNPSKPAKANPQKLYQNICDHQAHFVAGSPAIWENLANYCLEKNLQLPSVKSLVMFGAPVSLELHKKFQRILPNGTTYTPYGATECLPVAVTSGEIILNGPHNLMKKGKGTFLGTPAPGVRIEIVPIKESPIPYIKECDFLKPGQMGEIVVQSQTVTPEYVDLKKETEQAKMKDHLGNTWHRMGDIGYLDTTGQLWFGGRKSHYIKWRGKVLSSVQCEAIFNQHPFVKRTALITYRQGKQSFPAIVIERKDGAKPRGTQRKNFEEELLNMACTTEHTKEIKNFFYHPNFPVDVRHNIKIDRLRLGNEISKGKLS